jgi:hypothetical protein
MSETPEEKPAGGRPAEQRGSGGARWGVWIVVALVLYVLSIGPADWALRHLNLSDSGVAMKIIHVFYLPLKWLDENCEPANVFFAWYGGLWPR